MTSTRSVLSRTIPIILGLAACSSSSSPVSTHDDGGGSGLVDAGAEANALINMCFPDGDGINGGEKTFVLTVDDTGFSKMILATQNDAVVTLTLTNNGTSPHGFKVGCANVSSAYPNAPANCPTTACFIGAVIAPLAPGASATIVFDTPTPDGIIYPFTSNEPADSKVAGLNDGQWTLM
jgi:hypothetical protein